MPPSPCTPCMAPGWRPRPPVSTHAMSCKQHRLRQHGGPERSLPPHRPCLHYGEAPSLIHYHFKSPTAALTRGRPPCPLTSAVPRDAPRGSLQAVQPALGAQSPDARRACAYDRSPRLPEMCRVASIGLVVTVIWGGSGRVCEVRIVRPYLCGCGREVSERAANLR